LDAEAKSMKAVAMDRDIAEAIEQKAAPGSDSLAVLARRGASDEPFALAAANHLAQARLFAAAVAVLDARIAAEPASIQCLLTIAQIEAHVGNREGAVAALLRVLDAEPVNPVAWSSLSHLVSGLVDRPHDPISRAQGIARLLELHAAHSRAQPRGKADPVSPSPAAAKSAQTGCKAAPSGAQGTASSATTRRDASGCVIQRAGAVVSPTGISPDQALRRKPRLSIEEYDRREAAARISASYPALRSFAPVSFAQVGFPTRVTQESELARYVDIMHETDDRQYWLTEEQWSAAERDLILQLQTEIESLTSVLFGRPIQPLMNLFLAMPIIRMIEHLSKKITDGRRLTILEIGPGSGFLAGYLLLRGHRYIGMDNTQALYLWQHRLLQWLSDGQLDEFVLADTGPTGTPDRCAALIPWWWFAEMFRAPPLDVDVVVCDAAIGEMDPFAARYVIRLAKSLLEKSEIGTFLYKNLGEQRQNTAETVDHLFADINGYRSCRCGPVTLHRATDSIPDDLLISLAGGARRVDEVEGEPLTTAESFIDPESARILESYAFFDYLRIGVG
jgi:hypothetical protein